MKKVVLCLMLILIGITSECLAFNGSFYAKQGLYLGLSGNYNNIGGDFDGDTAEVAFDEIVAVPEVDDAFGFGVTLGYRYPKGALELTYVRSVHDASIEDVELGDAAYNVISLDGKYYFRADKPLQPYLLVGVCFPWLTVEDSSISVDYDDDTLELGDATFYGIGLNVGAGVAYYFNPKFALTGGVIYRFNWFTGLDGEENTGSLDDTLFGGGFNINLGITYTF